MKADYEILDGVVVIGCMLMVSGMLFGFFTIHDLPDAILPVLASLATAILGVPVAYGAFRWGNNVGAKHAAEAAADANKTSAAALAQIAGATSPLPNASETGKSE